MGAPLIRQCSLRGIYFVFSPPAQKQKKPSLHNNTFTNRCRPNLKTKVCRRVVSCQLTRQYFGSISKLLPFYRFICYLCIFKIKAIATGKLNIEELKKAFKDVQSLNTNDIVKFYRINDPELKTTTINWRIYTLVQRGILTRIGRGKFTLGNRKIFIPEINRKLKTINSKLKKEFPFLEICLWHTSSFNEFMIHQQVDFIF